MIPRDTAIYDSLIKKTSEGSFSTVSNPTFANTWSFYNIFRDLQRLHTFAHLIFLFFDFLQIFLFTINSSPLSYQKLHISWISPSYSHQKFRKRLRFYYLIDWFVSNLGVRWEWEWTWNEHEVIDWYDNTWKWLKMNGSENTALKLHEIAKDMYTTR